MPVFSMNKNDPSELDILSVVMDEMDYARRKHGAHCRTLAEWILIIEAELDEAKMANIKHTDDQTTDELRQVAACAIMALMDRGLARRRDWTDMGLVALSVPSLVKLQAVS